jgi:hypothetical protein
MSDATTTVWYATVDQSHKILVGATRVDVSETLNIAELKKLVGNPGCCDVNPARLNIYRPNMTVEQAEEMGAGKIVGGKWSKLLPSKKIASLNLGEEEILLVELPRMLSLLLLVPL